MKDLLFECVTSAGRLLLEHQANLGTVTRKESHGSIVTAADLASERLITERIAHRFPEHNLLGEETGFQQKGSEFTWVIDPLDGTSNYAAGLPWFGVLLAVLRGSQPVLGAMHLPALNILLLSELGQGVTCAGHPVGLTAEADLANVLCSFGLDPSSDPAVTRQQGTLLANLAERARGLRATNCLLDASLVLRGKFGVWLNNACKIWDIAPMCLMFQETGACFTDWSGQPITLDLSPTGWTRKYAVLAANPDLHRQTLALMEGCPESV